MTKQSITPLQAADTDKNSGTYKSFGVYLSKSFGNMAQQHLEVPSTIRRSQTMKTNGSRTNSTAGDSVKSGPPIPSARRWRKVGMIGRLALSVRRAREESEEKLRKRRIAERWTRVRRIARAAVLLSLLKDDSNEHEGFNAKEIFKLIVTKPSAERSRKDIDRLLRVIGRLSFFSSMSETQRRKFCEVMELDIVPTKHHVVFEQGQEATHFYVVLDGRLQARVSKHRNTFAEKDVVDEISKAHPIRDHDITIAPTSTSGTVVGEMQTGESFGGVDLTNEIPRSESVISQTRCELLTITKTHFRNIIQEYLVKEYTARIDFMRSSKVFAGLSEATMSYLAPRANIRRYSVGSVIFHQGDPVDVVLFLAALKRGRCRVSKLLRTDRGNTPLTSMEARHVRQRATNVSGASNREVELLDLQRGLPIEKVDGNSDKALVIKPKTKTLWSVAEELNEESEVKESASKLDEERKPKNPNEDVDKRIRKHKHKHKHIHKHKHKRKNKKNCKQTHNKTDAYKDEHNHKHKHEHKKEEQKHKHRQHDKRKHTGDRQMSDDVKQTNDDEKQSNNKHKHTDFRSKDFHLKVPTTLIKMNLLDVGPGESVTEKDKFIQMSDIKVGSNSRSGKFNETSSFKSGTNAFYEITLTALTCVELIFFCHHDIVCSIPENERQTIQSALHSFPNGDNLTALYRQRRDWQDVQRRLVDEQLCQTVAGRRILRTTEGHNATRTALHIPRPPTELTVKRRRQHRPGRSVVDAQTGPDRVEEENRPIWSRTSGAKKGRNQHIGNSTEGAQRMYPAVVSMT